MAVWYEGNLNNAENRREENGVVYYIRGVRVVDGADDNGFGVGHDALGTHHNGRAGETFNVGDADHVRTDLKGEILNMLCHFIIHKSHLNFYCCLYTMLDFLKLL